MLDRSWTVADLVPQLSEPEKWLAGILSNFVTYGYDPRSAFIRYGLMGNGRAPNYIIQESGKPITVQIDGQSIELWEDPHRTFNGRTAKEMVELDDLEWRDDHWSTAMLTFDQAKALLVKLRH